MFTNLLQLVQMRILIFSQEILDTESLLYSIWKRTTADFVTPLENIEFDCTVRIRFDFDNCDSLFILGLYLPSSDGTVEESKEYLDFLWALYDSLSDKGHVLVLSAFNGDLGTH